MDEHVLLAVKSALRTLLVSSRPRFDEESKWWYVQATHPVLHNDADKRAFRRCLELLFGKDAVQEEAETSPPKVVVHGVTQVELERALENAFDVLCSIFLGLWTL